MAKQSRADRKRAREGLISQATSRFTQKGGLGQAHIKAPFAPAEITSSRFHNFGDSISILSVAVGLAFWALAPTFAEKIVAIAAAAVCSVYLVYRSRWTGSLQITRKHALASVIAVAVLGGGYVQLRKEFWQDRTAVIDGFSVAASKDRAGPWEDLVPIPLQHVNLFALGSNVPLMSRPTSVGLSLGYGTARIATVPAQAEMKHAISMGLYPSILASEVEKPIDPHASVWGWIALDSLRHNGLSPGQIFFRFKIKDSADAEDISYTAELPRKYPGDPRLDINCGALVIKGMVEDISSSHLKYFSDPFATP